MKKILSIIALIAAVTMFTACGSDDASYSPTAKLEVTSADVLFEAEGGDGSIILNTDNTVSATTDASWLTLTIDGNKVIVTANPNLSLEGRNALIKLRAGSTEAEVTATQKSSFYGVPSTEYEIGDYQASLNIPVVHSQTVTVENQTSWLTVTWNEETNQIEIVAEDNDEVEPRKGTITLTMGDYSDEITIVQRGFLLELEEEEVSINDDEQTVAVKVNHSRAIANVESQADWISVRYNAKDSTLVCDVTANDTGWERTGTVTITSGPLTRTLSISQFDYEKDAYGQYDLIYATDIAGTKWSYLPAEVTEDGLTVQIDKTTSFTLPIIHDADTRTMYVGPSLSVIGTYASIYTIRLHMGFVYGTNLYYTYALSIQDDYYCYATFETVEYPDGSTSAMAEFAGSILSPNDFLSLSFYAYDDPEKTEEANMKSHLVILYYPYLERVLTVAPSGEGGEGGGAKQRRAPKRNYTAPLGSKENPIPAYNNPLKLAK